MLCSGRILAISHSPARFDSSGSRRYLHRNLQPSVKWRTKASDAGASSFSSSDDTKTSVPFCIIEGPETVQDFAKMESQEIQDNIRSRRNKIFLLMEEVRRLRIQQRIKNTELGIVKEEQENELPNFPSFIPFLPPLNSTNLRQYYATCFSLIAGIMLFGGLLAPSVSSTTLEDSWNTNHEFLDDDLS